MDLHRQALGLVFTVTLPMFDAEIPTFTDGRAYMHEEMEQVAPRQAPHNALGTRIAFRYGLRASGLIELREAHELAPEPDHPWRSDLFLRLLDGVIYRTTGKGRLARSVWIPLELHEQLQLCRLEMPVAVMDRSVHRTRVLDLEAVAKLPIRAVNFFRSVLTSCLVLSDRKRWLKSS
jgi:hypothetical protein